MPDGSVPINQTRDFETLDEMNEAIINNINEVVGPNDVLIHLGDWSFGGFENVEIFRRRIVCGEIHLVFGNHDHHIEKNKENCQKLFVTTRNFLRLEYQGGTIEAMHYPISSWNNLRKGRIHLHGHSHLPNDMKISHGRRMDIGMDGHPEFRPYDLVEECIIPLKNLPVGSELGHLDHHTDDIKGIVG